MINRNRLIDRFLKYVAVDSESGNEKRFRDLLGKELKVLGAEVEYDGPFDFTNGTNIKAKIDGTGEAVMLCAHMDTVSPGKGIVPKVNGSYMESSGDTILAADDKSGVAIIMEVIESVLEGKETHRPIEILFTVCEETGLLGSRNTDMSFYSAKEAYVFDSSLKGKIVTKAPSRSIAQVKITGKAAHAAVAPQNGLNAVSALGEVLSGIPQGNVGEGIINIADVYSSSGVNVVPDIAGFNMDIRDFTLAGMTSKKDLVLSVCSCAEKKTCCHVEVTFDDQFDAFDNTSGSAAVERLISIGREYGIEYETTETKGGSDTAQISKHGIDAVNVSTGMETAHSKNEKLDLDYFAKTAEIVYQLIL